MHSRQAGMTLLEVMLALGLSSMLLLAVLNIVTEVMHARRRIDRLNAYTQHLLALHRVWYAASHEAAAIGCSDRDAGHDPAARAVIAIALMAKNTLPAVWQHSLHAMSPVAVLRRCAMYNGHLQWLTTAYYLAASPVVSRGGQSEGRYASGLGLYRKVMAVGSQVHALPRALLADGLSAISFKLCSWRAAGRQAAIYKCGADYLDETAIKTASLQVSMHLEPEVLPHSKADGAGHAASIFPAVVHWGFGFADV